MNKAIFLDRDGTIIYDHGYIRDPNAVELIPGACEALRQLQSEGWLFIIVSNQSGVGRGLIAPDEMVAVQARFMEIMERENIRITASYLCRHHPDENCLCRKPGVASLLDAARDYAIDLTRSWMIGDRESDVQCGRNAGCSSIWLWNPHDWPAALALLRG